MDRANLQAADNFPRKFGNGWKLRTQKREMRCGGKSSQLEANRR